MTQHEHTFTEFERSDRHDRFVAHGKARNGREGATTAHHLPLFSNKRRRVAARRSELPPQMRPLCTRARPRRILNADGVKRLRESSVLLQERAIYVGSEKFVQDPPTGGWSRAKMRKLQLWAARCR